MVQVAYMVHTCYNPDMIKSRLKYTLLDRNMTMMELAERTGVPYSTLSRFANDHNDGVSYRTLAAICAALDVQPGDLLEYRPEGGAQ